MRSNIIRILAGSVAVVLSIGSATAASVIGLGGPTVGYTMSGTYTQGCFDPCLCPIMLTDQVTGSFRLTPVSIVLGDPVNAYTLSNVTINVGPPTPRPSPTNPRYTGSGSYQILSGITVTHRMQLDLTSEVDGTDQHFDSGWVIGGFEFPDIHTTVSINGMVCFDTVIGIDATPANPADLNMDGHVNGLDLAQLLGSWGRCPVCIIGPCPCPPDLDHNGTVNGLDLALLLGQWG